VVRDYQGEGEVDVGEGVVVDAGDGVVGVGAVGGVGDGPFSILPLLHRLIRKRLPIGMLTEPHGRRRSIDKPHLVCSQSPT